jgi:Tol biopolymer transport system component
MTGQTLQRYTPDQFEDTPLPNDALLNPLWSPDGSHLLMAISGSTPMLVIVASQNPSMYGAL